MKSILLLQSPSELSDMREFLQRLDRFGEAEVRLRITPARGRDDKLVAYGCTLPARGLQDPCPTVLVARGFRLAGATPVFDRTVPVRAILDRMVRIAKNEQVPPVLPLPPQQTNPAWAGHLPKIGGWQPLGTVTCASLEKVAREGAARVREALPKLAGEAVARRVRSGVWGLEMIRGVPAGAAYAASSMGFLLGEETAKLSENAGWKRLSTKSGHVLVKHQAVLG